MKLILVVDDDEFSLSAMHQLLSSRYRLALCKNSANAPALIEKLSPDLVVTDYKMPGMSGFELLAWIRTTEAFKELPVIVQSGTNPREFQDDHLDELKVDYMIEKRLSHRELPGVIERLLG